MTPDKQISILKPSSSGLDYPVDQQDAEVDEQYVNMKNLLMFDSISLHNDTEFHKRQKILQDICSDSHTAHFNKGQPSVRVS